MLTALANKAKMALWVAKIERIVAKPPGSDDGFSAESLATDATLTVSRSTTWGIVCDEMLDTQHSRVHFDRSREELCRRGITDAEFTEMQRFAWLTVGWMNFETMGWEWCGLDAGDIRHAIEWQHRDAWISNEERDRRLEYVQRYENAV